MSDILNDRPPTSFWVIGALALVWNLMGLFMYYSHVTMSPEALGNFTEAQQNFFTTTPAWATSAYAIAVTAGVLGSLMLLMRKAWATLMFALSLAGVVVQDLHAFVLSDGIEVWGTDGLYVPATVFIIAVFLVIYSRSAKAKGWTS